MSRRSRLSMVTAAVLLSVAACGSPSDVDSADSGRVSSARPSPTAEASAPTVAASPSKAARAADQGADEESERPAAAGDCEAYADSDRWCTDGIGDYDCEGGSGNGPNYAPRGVEVVEPGVDPFGLDRDNNGEGCVSAAAPAPDPPADPGTDPRFDTCGAAIAAGYGPYHRGQDPEYDWYRDADGDGVVCES